MFLAAIMIVGSPPDMSVNAAGESKPTETSASGFDAYRAPVLSGPVQTWIYKGDTFDYEDSRNKVFADDQEDGDLTKSIIQEGSVDTSKLGPANRYPNLSASRSDPLFCASQLG